MKERTKKTIYITCILFGLAAFGVVAVRSVYDSSFLMPAEIPNKAIPAVSVLPFTETPAGTVTTVSEQEDPKPVKSSDIRFAIRIPSIRVDAKVEDVGINALGNIATPKKLANAAWYQYGAMPGEEGTTVMLGHVENGLGLPGVFHDLKDVAIGAEIFVTGKDGTEHAYLVTAVDDYALATAPVHDILYSPTNKEALHIITCGKTWSGGKFHYDRRVVVTAVPA